MSKSRSSACRLHGAPARPPLEHAEGEEETSLGEARKMNVEFRDETGVDEGQHRRTNV